MSASSFSSQQKVLLIPQQFMDLFASLFGLTLLAVSAGVAYHYGIKPDRAEKKRQTERVMAEVRRQRWERSRKRSTV